MKLLVNAKGVSQLVLSGEVKTETTPIVYIIMEKLGTSLGELLST